MPSHSLQELKDNIRGETTNISRWELHRLPRNIYRKLQACSEDEGRHFETLLWIKARWTVRRKQTLQLQADAGFVGDTAPATAAILWSTIRGTLCASRCTNHSMLYISILPGVTTHSVPLDYDTVRSGRWLQTFRRNTLLPTCAPKSMSLQTLLQTGNRRPIIFFQRRLTLFSMSDYKF